MPKSRPGRSAAVANSACVVIGGDECNMHEPGVMSDIEALIEIEGGSRWLAFERPTFVVDASRHAEVADVIRRSEAHAVGGGYAVGFVRYEAAAAFGLDVHPVATRDDGLPLAWFALFDAADVRETVRPVAAAPYRL